MTSTTLRVAAGAAVAILSMAACDGDAPDPGVTASPKPTPEVSVSPPPDDAPELSAEQQIAFDEAVAKYDEYLAFVARTGAAPDQDTEAIARELATYTVMPATQDFSDSLDELRVNNARTEGQPGNGWTSPMEVSAERVEFQRCNTPGDWALVGEDDRRVEQEENSISNVTMVYTDDVWLVRENLLSEETC